MGVERFKPRFKLRVIEVSGSAYDRGYKHGEECRESIKKFVKEFYEGFEGRLTKDQIQRHVRKHIPFIEEYSSEVAEEIKGIADGSGCTYEEIVMLSLLEEIEGFTRLMPHTCTALAAAGEATAEEAVFIGENLDSSVKRYAEGKFPILLKVKDSSGPSYIAWSMPGIPAGAGLNSEGIGIVWNSVERVELRIGVPTYVIISEIMHQKTIGDALGAVFTAKRAGCFNFLIADGHGELYDVEATPSDAEVYYSDTCIGHANHFVSEKMKKKITVAGFGRHSSSLVRHNRVNKLLKENLGRIDLKTCMSILSDHVNYPYSICRHPEPVKDEKAYRGVTWDSLLMVLNKGECWISHGPPCSNRYQKHVIE